MASIALQILVQGSSADDAATKLSRLYRELYGVRKSVLGSEATVVGGQAFTLKDATGSESWLLQNCHLSSSVSVDRRDAGKTYIVSFTLSPLVPCWEAEQYTIHTFEGNGVYFVPVGDVPVGNFQIIWQFDNELQVPSLQDAYSASTTRVNVTLDDREIYSGESGWIRYDSDAYTCGWVTSAEAWGSSYYTSYGDINKRLTIPEQGSLLCPYPSTGNAGLYAKGCTSAKLRFRKTKAII